MRILAPALAGLLVALAAAAQEPAAHPIPIVFDTDFVLPPGDDGMALLLALQSPELDVLAVTTVAGNDRVEQATADALWVLERVGRSEVPVYMGADMPWRHAPSDFAEKVYGSWYSDEPAEARPGGFARAQPEDDSAVEYLLRTVLDRPGEITIVALGPLTNVATAIRMHPRFAESVKELVIMGGAVAALPDGHGNITPNAEFNFWVDPEAARVALRSGIPIQLSPLNVSRKTSLTKSGYERMTDGDTAITRLLEETMGPRFEREPDRVFLMYDQVAVGSLVDPSLVTTESMFVDVDDQPGISYGTSVGGREIWPGAEGARRMDVQHDLDWPRFMDLFVERMLATPRAAGERR